jgi:hypothetical protein
MGCIETKRTPPSVVIPTSTAAPIYVKSALKNSRGNIKGRSQRLSDSNREIPTVNKSVNFDEKVEVKLRTPTPKLMDYDIPPSPTMPTRRRLSNNNNDDDDIGSTHSSVSSQEDFNNGQLKPSSSVSSFPTLQRNYSSNSSWHRSNSIAVIPSMNNTNEKHPPPPPLGGIQQPPVNTNSYPTENPIMPRGKPFKVRRKTTYPVLPESSPEPSAEPSYHPPVQSAHVPVKRPLPNTNAVFVDHRTSFPNNELSSQPVYYSFTRRPKTNPDLTEN